MGENNGTKVTKRISGVLDSVAGVLRNVAGPLQLLALGGLIFVVLESLKLILKLIYGENPGNLGETERFIAATGPAVIFSVFAVTSVIYMVLGGVGRKEGPKTVEQILANFARDPIIPSPLPVMVMTVPDLLIRRVSASAARFFGKNDKTLEDTVVGRSVTDLIAEMRRGLDPPSAYWSDLGLDQSRVIEELIEGEITYARLPVRINRDHPSDEFRNKTFVPIITERDVVGIGDDKLTIARILYLDIAELPRNLFTERVWNEAVEGLNLQNLVQQLREIKTAFDTRFTARTFPEEKARVAARAFKEDEDGGKERCDALNDAIEKLEQSSSSATLEDLSRAGWFELRDEASRMPQKPREVLRLIDAILGKV